MHVGFCGNSWVLVVLCAVEAAAAVVRKAKNFSLITAIATGMIALRAEQYAKS